MTFQSNQFAQDLRSARGSRSLRELSEIISISPATIQRVENGKMPDLLTYAALCRWMGASMNSYFPHDAPNPLHEILKDIVIEQATCEISGEEWASKMIDRINRI